MWQKLDLWNIGEKMNSKENEVKREVHVPSLACSDIRIKTRPASAVEKLSRGLGPVRLGSEGVQRSSPGAFKRKYNPME